MKVQIVLLFAVGLTAGHVIPAIRNTVVAPAPVVVAKTVTTQYHAQDELGQYTFGYSGGPSAKHETKTADGITSGGYSYIDGNGLVQSAAYVSDPVNGFRVAATNLPAGPAVPTSHETVVAAQSPAIISKTSVVGAAVPATVVTATAAPILAKSIAAVTAAPIVASGIAAVTAAPIVSRVATVTAAPIIAAAPIATAVAAVPVVPVQPVVSVAPIVAAAPSVIATAPIVAAAPVVTATSIVSHGDAVYIGGNTHTVKSSAVYLPRPTPTPAVSILESDRIAIQSAAAANAAASVAAAKQAAADAELLQAAERIAAAKAASTPVQDTLEVLQAKNAHLAAVQATRARDATVAAKEAQENAILNTRPAVVAGSTLLAARPTIVTASAPVVVNKVAIPSSVVAVTPVPHVVASVTPTVVAAAAPSVVLATAVPVVGVAKTASIVSAPAVAVSKTAAVVAPVAAGAVIVNPVVSTQYHAQDELGQYTFGYAGGPSAKHEVKTVDGITRGGYTYIDGHGDVQSTAYVSDAVNGFRVAATNLPVQPGPKYIPDTAEVAEAKAKLFKLQAEHIAKL